METTTADPDAVERELRTAYKLAKESTYVITSAFGLKSPEAARALLNSALARLVDASGLIAKHADPTAPGGRQTPTGRGYQVKGGAEGPFYWAP